MAKKKRYRWFLYFLIRFAAAFVYFLPRRLALRLARFLGTLAYLVLLRQRRKVFENLRLTYGTSISKKETRRIARGVFRHLTQTAVEVLQFPKLDLEKMKTFVEFEEGTDVYRKLLKEGHGIISITAHLGNWELLAGVIMMQGFPGKVIGRRIYYEPYNERIVSLRLSLRVETVYRGQSMREVMRLLKQNQIIGILPDQDMENQRGVFVDFFGRAAYTTDAPVRLALHAGAPILANFLIREPADRYRLVTGDVIRPVVETTHEEAVRKYTERWMKVFEKMIRQYPDQWAWMHNRWKTQRSTSSPNGSVGRPWRASPSAGDHIYIDSRSPLRSQGLATAKQGLKHAGMTINETSLPRNDERKREFDD